MQGRRVGGRARRGWSRPILQFVTVLISLRSTEILYVVMLTVEILGTCVRPTEGTSFDGKSIASHATFQKVLFLLQRGLGLDQKQEIIEFLYTLYSHKAF